MVAPTSKDRISMIAKEAKGFIYVVSSMGVTGMRSSFAEGLSSVISEIRAVTDVPCAIGFGISDPSQAKEMSGYADGVIVGSAIIKILAEHGKDAPSYVGKFIKEMKDAVR